MSIETIPAAFLQLRRDEIIYDTELAHTQDGFWMICRSLSDILARKSIMDFPDADGTRLSCDKFFDDWFLYAVPSGNAHVYGLLKLREQEHDAERESPADGDTPGVTISFVPFSPETLLDCLAAPTNENLRALDSEIDRVVARRGQRHHKDMKRYFINPGSEGAYLVADRYVKHIACFAEHGELDVPERYGEISRGARSRLSVFVESVNQAAGRSVCDHKKIYFQSAQELTEHERAVILATHTGNTSIFSFASEVEYHARFLLPWARIRIPFCKKSFYDSAIRADMTIGDAERRPRAPYYRENSRIVKKQCRLHKKLLSEENV